MSFDAVTLFNGVMDPGTAETLASICRPQGLCRAIDIAMVDESMATELFQGRDGELREPLMKAVTLARPLVKGWATSFRLKEGGSVGGVSGGASAASQPPLPSAPCSDGALALVQGTRPEPSVAPGREAYFGTALLPVALGLHQEDSRGGA